MSGERETWVDYDFHFNQALNQCVHKLDTDPSLENLRTSLYWFNKTEKKLKYYDGTTIRFIVSGEDLESCVKRLGDTLLQGELLIGGEGNNVVKYEGDAGLIWVDQNGIVRTAIPGTDYLTEFDLSNLNSNSISEDFTHTSEEHKLTTIGAIKSFFATLLENLGLGYDTNVISQVIPFEDTLWTEIDQEYFITLGTNELQINPRIVKVYNEFHEEEDVYVKVQDHEIVLGSVDTFKGKLVILGTSESVFEPPPPDVPTEDQYFTFDIPTQTITGYNIAGGLYVYIPDQISGLDVLGIGEEAFAYKGIRSVKIPSTVTSIGTAAFRNNLLSTVELPDGLTFLGTSAFRSNTLTEFNFPSSLTSIYAHAFSGNQLQRLEIPSTITTIGERAFQYNRLEFLSIPCTVTELGIRSFGNNKIPHVVIPGSITDIPDYCFENNLIVAVHIPSSITRIGYGAFINNSLKWVNIPNSVVNIFDHAFRNNNIELATLPEALVRLEHGVFYMNRLSSISLPATLTYIGMDALRSNLFSSIVIPNSVTGIGKRALMYNNLSSITIGSDVVIDINLLHEDNNYFRDEYLSESSVGGTYTGSQDSTWSKE